MGALCAWRGLLRGGSVLLIAGCAAGCSLSFPIGGIRTDAAPTGSIDHAAAFLSPELDAEDVRRAKAALAVALDPQGSGDRVAWQNPRSGAMGSFAASALPFTERDRVCRAFAADVLPKNAPELRLSGSACREDDGTWVMREERSVGKA